MPTKTAVPMWKTPAHTRQERQSWIPDVFAISEDSGIILYPALDYYHSQYLQVHISWSGVLEAKGRRNYSTLLYTSWNSLDRTASTFIYASILSQKILLIYRCFLIIANRWSHIFLLCKYVGLIKCLRVSSSLAEK